MGKEDYKDIAKILIFETERLLNAFEVGNKLFTDILAELEADPNDGGQSRLSPELVERIKKVLEK